MKVRAATLEEVKAPFVIEDLELGGLQPDEVLVKVAASGICHTDLSMRNGSLPVAMPVVLGHEGAGVVEAIGERVCGVQPGDRVSLTLASCGLCPSCQDGTPTQCREFFARNFYACRPDGSTALARGERPVHSHFMGQSSFASHAVVPERSVVKIGEVIPFELAAPLGCAIRTGAGSVLNVLRPRPGSSIAVFGVGAVGLSAVMAAKIAGCGPIIAVDLIPDRLDLALELGATCALNATHTDIVADISARTAGGVDYALEMSGSTAALLGAMHATAPGGVLGLVGAPPFGTEVSFDVNVIVGTGRTIRGITGGGGIPQVFIPELVRFWEEGRLPVEKMIETFTFDRINEAAGLAEQGSVLKPVLIMS
jgi:aryl-alcohol dehydrogenase